MGLEIHNIARWVRVRRDDASWGEEGRGAGEGTAENGRENGETSKESLGVLGGNGT